MCTCALLILCLQNLVSTAVCVCVCVCGWACVCSTLSVSWWVVSVFVQSVDLPRALTGIRNQRMHMVQTLGQYQFIHDTLIHYLKNTRLIWSNQRPKDASHLNQPATVSSNTPRAPDSSEPVIHRQSQPTPQEHQTHLNPPSTDSLIQLPKNTSHLNKPATEQKVFSHTLKHSFTVTRLSGDQA